MAEHEIFAATTRSEFLVIAQRHGCIVSLLPTPENLDADGNPMIAIEKEDASGNIRVFLLSDIGNDAQVSQLLLADAFAALFQPSAI